jgi:hypothetical protein
MVLAVWVKIIDMRSLLLFLLLTVQFVSFSQGTTGIYKVKWFIDSRFTNELIVNGNGGGNFGLDRLNIPEALYDSVVMEIQEIVQQELKSDAQYIYPLSRSGKELRTVNTAEQVGGFPRGTKRKAMRTEYKEYYVKFKIHVGLNKTFGIGGEMASYSRLKPYVRVKMKAYGLDRRVKYRKYTRRSDFKSLNSFEYNLGGVNVTNTNGLAIEEVLDMVFKGLDKFRNKVK